AIAGALVEHRALEHGVDELSVWTYGQTLESSVAHSALGVAGIAGEVRLVAVVARDEIRGRGEGPGQRAVAIELVDGGAVLVRDEELSVRGIDHEAFRIESPPQHVDRRWGEAVEVQRARRIRELHRLDHLEVRDGPRGRIDVDGELLHARVIGQGASARPAI